MHSSAYIAALGALFTAVTAVPMKRDLIINTVTEVEIVTEVLTATVWVDAPEATDAPASYHEAHFTQPAYEHPTAPAWTEAVPTSSSSIYVAPPPPPAAATTSSTSTQAAPVVYTPQPAPPAPEPTTSSIYVAPAPVTTSSIYVAPAPAPAPATTSTSEYVAPAPAYTPPTTTSTTAAAPVSTSTGGSSGTYTGDITYYAVGLGSCGETNTDSEMVVAMAHGMMDKATMCGKTVTLSYQGVTQQAKVVDTCMSCVNGDLDLSPALFKAIAPNGDGRVHGVSWSFT